MDDWDIASILIEIINSKPPVNMMNDILHSVMKQITDIEQSKLDYIAPLLHQIYVSDNLTVRASILDFCRKLEEVSLTSITEKYLFDYLISQSLGQKITLDFENSLNYQLSNSSSTTQSGQLQLSCHSNQVQSHQNFHKIHHIFNYYNNFSKNNISNPIDSIDDEKLSCFKYIETLIYQKGGYLSPPIIRALISLYESDFNYHEGCKWAVIDLLAQASIYFTSDQKYLMPSVLRVFSSYLFKDSTSMIIPALFAYSIENGLPIIYDDLFLMEFLWPLSNYSLFLEKKKMRISSRRDPKNDPDYESLRRIEQIEGSINEKTEVSKESLIFFLRTWPGLLYFGIKNKAIEYLMICMAYKPKVIIQILRSLLNLKENTSSVTDGYSGFLLAELLKLGLIEKLNQKTSICSQNSTMHSNDEIVNTIKGNNSFLPSFSFFSSSIPSSQSPSTIQSRENTEIVKCCEDFVNELLPFTSHCLNNDDNSPDYKTNRALKQPHERKTVHKSFQRSSFLNSDADLEFYNMSSLLNINTDEYSPSVNSNPMSNSSFKLNSDESFTRMIDVAQVITHKSSLISVSDVMGKKKDIDFMTIKWTEIQILLNVVLPYDQSEATASIKLLTSMINFLSSSEFSNASPAKRIEMFESYSSLFDLLLNGKFKEKIIEDNTKFREVIVKTIHDLIHAKTAINFINRNKNNNKLIENRSDSIFKSPTRSPLNLNNISSTNSILQQAINDECFDMNSSKWFVFRLLMKIMSNTKGIAILESWKINTAIISIGSRINCPQLAEAILSEILFYPDSRLSIPTFSSFLNSQNEEIHKHALSQLKVLRNKLPNFIQQCFKPILIQHIKEAKIKENSLKTSLNFLGEIISTDEDSLKTVCEDIELIRVIFNNNHMIFSLLLSREETKKTWDSNNHGSSEEHHDNNISLTECRSPRNDVDSSGAMKNKSDRRGQRLSMENLRANFNCIKFEEIVETEIKWWMDNGNLNYLRAFHSAVDATFSDTLDEAILMEPAIFIINGCAQPPPHLFGQLSKLPEGAKMLRPQIEELVNILVTLIDNPNLYSQNKDKKDESKKDKNDKKGKTKKDEKQSNNDDNSNDENSSDSDESDNDSDENTKSSESRVNFTLRKAANRISKRNNISPISQRKSIYGSPVHGRVGPQISRQAADENVCSILFALAQFGSVPSTSQIVEELGIVEKMIQAAVASASYVVKGALISCLSFFAPSDYLSSILQRYKWQKFRFGNRSCIIPRKPRSLFRETAVKRLNVVTAANEESSNFSNLSSSSVDYSFLPIPKMPNSMTNEHKKPPIFQQNISLKHQKARQPSSSFDISTLASMSSNGIGDEAINLILSIVFDPAFLKNLLPSQNNAKKTSDADDMDKKPKNNGISYNQSNSSISSLSISNAALEVQNKLGKQKINSTLKIWTNRLISNYAVENNARDLINYLFKDVPLMEPPKGILSRNETDQKMIILAKFNEIAKSSKGAYKEKSFKDIQPLYIPLSEIEKVKPPFPEASLSPQDFQKAISLPPSVFYDFDDEKKEKIRNRIRGE